MVVDASDGRISAFLDDIIKFEDGQMGLPEQVLLFSRLVKSGIAWHLQGFYRRTAEQAIHSGLLSEHGDVNWNVVEEATQILRRKYR